MNVEFYLKNIKCADFVSKTVLETDVVRVTFRKHKQGRIPTSYEGYPLTPEEVTELAKELPEIFGEFSDGTPVILAFISPRSFVPASPHSAIT